MARVLNENIAFFLKDLLSVYDRGLIMDVIFLYQNRLPNAQVNLKIEFLEIICDYEHYIQLNLPLPDRIQDVASLELTLWKNHFLAGTLVREVIKLLKKQDWVTILPAIDVLYFLLVKHKKDPRYQNVLANTCIPGIYFLFVIQLIDANNEDYRCISDAPLQIRKKLFGCFLWIVKNMQRKIIQQWWSLDTQKRIHSFFVILANCVNTFEYESTGESQAITLTSAKLKKSQASYSNLAASQPGISESIKKRSMTKLALTKSADDLREQYASRESTMITLDLLMDFMNDNVNELRKPDSVYMDKIVVNLLVMMFKQNQCVTALTALFAAARHIIVMFPGAFFVEQTPFAGDITYAILGHFNSPNPTVRSKAGGIFYLLLRVCIIIKFILYFHY